MTPRCGTEFSSTPASSVNENVNVPTRSASSTCSTRSRYQSRMYRAEKLLVAICTTSTLTVTTKPVSAAVAPTIDASRMLAVDAEYSRGPAS